MVIRSDMSVCDIAVEIPAVIPALEQMGIAYCCDGKRTLAEACAKRNLDLQQVLAELMGRHQENVTSADSRCLQAPVKELAEYVVAKHHAYTREQLALIEQLMAKVEERHGATHPELFEVSKAFAIMNADMKEHFACEETTLFPFIEALGTERQPELPASANGSIELHLAHMMGDHDQAGTEIVALRTLTKNYTPPSAACPTWRALYRAMEELEVDFYQHIHIENNILFPRALEQARIEMQKKESSAERAA